MLRRLIVALSLAAILGLIFAGPAKADGMDTFTYVFDGNTYVWQLPPDPPSGSFTTVPGALVEFDISYTLNMMSQPEGVLDFFDGGLQGGGFELAPVSDPNALILNAFGDQIFGGSDGMPTFSPGVFTLSNGTANGPTGTLTISAAPEPGTLLLIGTGMLAVFAIARKKLFT